MGVKVWVWNFSKVLEQVKIVWNGLVMYSNSSMQGQWARLGSFGLAIYYLWSFFVDTRCKSDGNGITIKVFDTTNWGTVVFPDVCKWVYSSFRTISSLTTLGKLVKSIRKNVNWGFSVDTIVTEYYLILIVVVIFARSNYAKNWNNMVVFVRASLRILFSLDEELIWENRAHHRMTGNDFFFHPREVFLGICLACVIPGSSLQVHACCGHLIINSR